MSDKRIWTMGVTVVVLLILLSIGNLFENLDAGHFMIIQSPIRGDMEWYLSPGIKWQGFGKVTVYNRRSQFWFSAHPDQGGTADQSITVRFNDGAHAKISGSISWEMPVDKEKLTAIHVKYGSQTAVEQEVVRTTVEKSVYMTGPLMSSKESYAERRNDLLALIEDQIQNGVFQTETISDRQKDPLSGMEKTVYTVRIKKGSDGRALRSDASPLGELGIRATNLSINQVSYDKAVENQIASQQQATMQVQTAMAEAKRAEQEAITAAKQGEANAAKAKWEQETIKAREVTRAEQEKAVAETTAQKEKSVAETAAQRDLEVAKLATQQAEQYKQAQLLKAEGDAEYKRRVMEADGALAQKLAAAIEINGRYAEAIRYYQGAWTPSVVMAGSATDSAPASAALGLVELLTAKTARDLALDVQIKAPGLVKK
ncbi:PHB domain-containing protein [Gammaproteobacteria bacterium]